jgi:hypothetical protein
MSRMWLDLIWRIRKLFVSVGIQTLHLHFCCLTYFCGLSPIRCDSSPFRCSSEQICVLCLSAHFVVLFFDFCCQCGVIKFSTIIPNLTLVLTVHSHLPSFGEFDLEGLSLLCLLPLLFNVLSLSLMYLLLLSSRVSKMWCAIWYFWMVEMLPSVDRIA